MRFTFFLLIFTLVSQAQASGNVTAADAKLEQRFKDAQQIIKLQGFCNDSISGAKPEKFELSKYEHLFVLPCYQAAYQQSFKAFIYWSSVDELTAVSILEFNSDGSKTYLSSTTDLMEASYDVKTKQLKTFAKYRGIADCGQSSVTEIKEVYGHAYLKTVEIREQQCPTDGVGHTAPENWPVVYKQ